MDKNDASLAAFAREFSTRAAIPKSVRYQKGQFPRRISEAGELYAKRIDPSLYLTGPARELNQFLEDLKRTVTTLPQKTSDLVNPHIGYSFPSKRQSERFQKNTAHDYPNAQQPESGKQINSSPSAVKEWFEGLINEMVSKNSTNNHDTTPIIRFLTGKVGSGKSTFINYISRRFAQDLEKKKVVQIIVRYRDFALDTKDHGHDYDWHAHFEQVLINRIALANLKIPECEKLLVSKEFSDYLRQNLIDVDEEGYQEQVNRLLRIISAKEASGQALLNAINELGTSTKLAISSYLHVAGFNYLLILDGLDFLNAEQISRGTFRSAFSAIGDCIFERRSRSYLSRTIAPILLITLRNCTYGVLAEEGNVREDNADFVQWQLVPTDPHSVLRRGAAFLVHESPPKSFIRQYEASFLDFPAQLLDLLKEVTEQDIISLFNYNYRKLLRYMMDVFRHIVNDIMVKEPAEARTLETLLYRMLSDRYRETLYQKRFSLHEILLIGEFWNYSNHYTCKVDTNTITPKTIHQFRGYAENVFNYVFREPEPQGSPPWLLIRFRIVQYLANEDYKPLDRVLEHIKSLGYSLTPELAKGLLHLLIGADIVKVSFIDGRLKYNATALGIYLTHHLSLDLRYVEHAVGTTLVPRAIASCIESRNRAPQKVPERVTTSVVNSYVFLNYIRFIEEIEAANLERSQGKVQFAWQISDELAKNLQHSSENVLASFAEGHHVEGRHDHISIDDIIRRISSARAMLEAPEELL